MADVSRPEAHIMDINTVNLWLTNAKHQPTKSVEIEGMPATRQASLVEFFTSVATSAAFQVAGALAEKGLGQLKEINNTTVALLEADYGALNPITLGAKAFVASKEFVDDVTNQALVLADDISVAAADKFELGTKVFKDTFVNPLDNKYTQWIAKAGADAVDYATKASSLSAYSGREVALTAAQQYTNQTSLPTFQSAKDTSNNLVQGTFTIEDAAKYGSTETAQAATLANSAEFQEETTNDIMLALGYKEQPTFDQLAGILSKSNLTDDLEAAQEDELEKRNADLTDDDNFAAWQASFAHLQDCVEAVRQESKDNLYYQTVVISQENALKSVERIQTVLEGVTDQTVLDTFDKCLKPSTKQGLEALQYFASTNENP